MRPYMKEKYFNLLQDRSFLIALDVGTAKGKIEYFNLNIRYLEEETSTQTVTKLLRVFELNGPSTGLTLHRMVDEFLFDFEGNFDLKSDNC